MMKYESNLCHVLAPEEIQVGKSLQYILDSKEKKLRNKVIRFLKTQWSNHTEEEATWESKDTMRENPKQQITRPMPCEFADYMANVMNMIFGAPPEHPYGAPSPSTRPAAMAAGGELRRDVQLPDPSHLKGRPQREDSDPSSFFINQCIESMAAEPTTDDHHLPHLPAAVLHACGHDPAVHPTPPSATDPASPISHLRPARLLCNRPTPNPSPSVELPITIQQRSQAADHTASITSHAVTAHEPRPTRASSATHLAARPATLHISLHHRTATPSSVNGEIHHEPAAHVHLVGQPRASRPPVRHHEQLTVDGETPSSRTPSRQAAARHHAQQLHAARPPDPPTSSVHAPPPAAHVPIKSNGRQTNPN
ncbi:hypothetical protein ACLOJK_023352 [Asimina triloba]